MTHSKADALALDPSLTGKREAEEGKIPFFVVRDAEGRKVGYHRVARWAWDSAWYGVKARRLSRVRDSLHKKAVAK